jgi:hypothetical protein
MEELSPDFFVGGQSLFGAHLPPHVASNGEPALFQGLTMSKSPVTSVPVVFSSAPASLTV